MIGILINSPAIFYITLATVGLIVGSFLNVIIHRIPIMLEKQWKRESEAILFPNKDDIQEEHFNIITPNSHCPACQHKIRAWENIPIISFLFLKGKCSCCNIRIPYRYPAIECISSVLTIMVGYQFGITVETLAYCIFVWCLLALTMIDLDTQLLPDSLTLPLMWSGLIFNSFNTTVSLHEALWGAIAGYLSLWSVYWIFKLITGKEGMGYGDFKLLAALGAWFGWMMLPIIILLSSLTGTIVAIGLIVMKLHERSKPLPFGPYLAAAGLTTLLWGDKLIQTYIQITNIHGF